MFILKASGPALTVKEAAVLAKVTEKVVRHEMSARILRPRRKARKRVELGASAVFYLSLVSRLPFELSKGDRRDLFEFLSGDRNERGRWRREADRLVLRGDLAVVLPTKEVARSVRARLKLFESGKKRVVSRADTLGGEPVFEGTRVSVRHVGELVKKGVPIETLHEDFPKLSDTDFDFARIFVDLGRPPGRPRKLKLTRQ